MKRCGSTLFQTIVLSAFLSGGLISNSVAERGPSSTPPEAFEWMHDLKKAQVKAAAEDKPLFVVFRCEP